EETPPEIPAADLLQLGGGASSARRSGIATWASTQRITAERVPRWRDPGNASTSAEAADVESLGGLADWCSASSSSPTRRTSCTPETRGQPSTKHRAASVEVKAQGCPRSSKRA